VPKLPYTIGYFPKGNLPDEAQLQALKDLGKRKKAIFIKLEPNIATPPHSAESLDEVRQFLTNHGCQRGRALFTPYSFVLDLTKSTDELLAGMKAKSRYNLKLAQSHGIQIVEDSTQHGFDQYLELLEQTTKRQQFYAHTKKYHTTMWQTMFGANIARLFKAEYQGQVLAAWIVFVFNNTLYYPYGASSRNHREKMPSYLLMWEVIQWGKRQGCTSFDMWGALGPQANPKDPWFGFHRFKSGFGAELTQSVGSYDLVIDNPLYSLYRVADRWRWRYLRFKSKLSL
jgi:lipid II:glycine glycyltransferase (peptidoglycan interpeptide bridge formation enzyme)